MESGRSNQNALQLGTFYCLSPAATMPNAGPRHTLRTCIPAAGHLRISAPAAGAFAFSLTTPQLGSYFGCRLVLTTHSSRRRLQASLFSLKFNKMHLNDDTTIPHQHMLGVWYSNRIFWFSRKTCHQGEPNRRKLHFALWQLKYTCGCGTFQLEIFKHTYAKHITWFMLYIFSKFSKK